MAPRPTLQQRAVPSRDVLFQQVGNETVLLNLSNESYFGLDPVGTRFWQLLADSPEIQPAFETMLGEFEVDAEQLSSDLLELVERMAKAGLVHVE